MIKKTIRLADYHSPDMQQQLEESVNAATTWGMWSGESALTDLHDRQIAVSELILANRSQSGEVDYLTVICRDITENKLAQENLREAQEQLREALKKETDAAREDPLTKVSNRRAFYELADVERSRARRYHHALSLAYIDVDGFKQVNDKFGHASGDRLLIRIASTLRHNLRSCDAVARLGGDEFAVLLPESDAHGAMGALKKLQHYLAEETAKEPCPVTFSIGVASFSEPPDTIDEMIRAADDLMYQVKTSGKNNLRVMEVCRAQTGSTSI